MIIATTSETITIPDLDCNRNLCSGWIEVFSELPKWFYFIIIFYNTASKFFSINCYFGVKIRLTTS